MKTYSHSKLSSFEQCPQRYKFRYIDRLKPEIEKTIESHLGTCVHDTLEWLYTQVQKDQIPTLDETIMYYTQKWKNTYTEDIAIVKEGLTELNYINKGVKFLIDYYIQNQPFQDGTFELEKKIEFNLQKNIKILGYIDRVVLNKEKNRYEVHDYKTASSLPTQDKVDTDRQLAFYALAIKELYGKDKEVCLIWHYLAHNKKICSFRTKAQLEKLKEDTLKLIRKIELTEVFPAKTSILCGWCEFKNQCPQFQELQKQNTQQEQTQKKEQTKPKPIKEKYPTLSKYLKD